MEAIVVVETIVMELILNGGNARNCALEAIAAARLKNVDEAQAKLKESDEFIRRAHKFQTELITLEANDKKTEISLILVHGQDHLMNAMTVRDMAEQMIAMYDTIYSQKD